MVVYQTSPTSPLIPGLSCVCNECMTAKGTLVKIIGGIHDNLPPQLHGGGLKMLLLLYSVCFTCFFLFFLQLHTLNEAKGVTSWANKQGITECEFPQFTSTVSSTSGCYRLLGFPVCIKREKKK